MKATRTVVIWTTFTLLFSGSGFFASRAGAQPLGQHVVIESFAVGNAPFWLTSEGDNIWVTNLGDDTVSKLRASDGVVLGTFPVGSVPGWLTFGGTNIWVANQSQDSPGAPGNSVTKLRASDGANLGTFDAGDVPTGIAWDGANIWVANYYDGSVRKLRGSDGALLGVFYLPSLYAEDVLFDGTNIWVAVQSGAVKVRPSDGTVLDTIEVDGEGFGLAYDGTKMWLTSQDFGANTVTTFRASDGKVQGTFGGGSGQQVLGIAFDGANVWIASSNADRVTRLRTRNGANLGSLPVGDRPKGVLFDGTSIWVANFYSGTVSKIGRAPR